MIQGFLAEVIAELLEDVDGRIHALSCSGCQTEESDDDKLHCVQGFESLWQ